MLELYDRTTKMATHSDRTCLPEDVNFCPVQVGKGGLKAQQREAVTIIGECVCLTGSMICYFSCMISNWEANQESSDCCFATGIPDGRPSSKSS